jgi:delta24-sterol reductase
MTTASHKYGLLQETVEEYEVVLGDGRCVKARRDNDHADLWHAFPWSHGSLGLLVGLTLRVVPVTSHVRLDYTPVRGQAAYCAKIRQASLAVGPGCADFVEATVFSRDDCCVMEASFVPDEEVDASRVNALGWWWKPWFYTHVRDTIMPQLPATPPSSSGGGGGGGGASATKTPAFVVTEFVPTYQYIMRHDRGIFWTLDDQLPEAIGNHWLFRWPFGWLCPPKVTFLKLLNN